MQDICRDARKRISMIARDHAEQFDATILHNHVYEGVPEHTRLREYLDLAERSYDLASDVSGESHDRAAFAAAEELNDGAEELVDEVVAELVAELDDETLAEWGDAWDSEAIQNAREERDEFFDQSNSHAAALAQQLREAEEGDLDA
jgi:restriction endonuclease Mrr